MTAKGSNVDASDYTQYRPLMFSIAYRMTGSVSDAEDIVQEAFLRATKDMRQAETIKRRTWPRSPPGWPSTTCARRGSAASPTSAPGSRSPS